MNSQQIVAAMRAALKDPDFMSAALSLMNQISVNRNSQLLDQAWNDREIVRKVVFDQASGETNLSNARTQVNAYKVPFKFKSVRVESASGADVEVQMIVGKNLSGRDPILLRQNDTINFDYLTEGWLYWEAQSGETMEILFGIDVEFRQGSLISEQAGGVSISEGVDVETDTVASVTTTASILCAADTTRLITQIQNNGGIDIFLGDSTVTAANGIRLAAGGVYDWKNSDALYAITASGTNADIRRMNMR